MTKEEIPNMAAFMGDFWKLIKAFWEVKDTDEYWQSFTLAVNKVCMKYRGTEAYDTAKDLAIAFMGTREALIDSSIT